MRSTSNVTVSSDLHKMVYSTPVRTVCLFYHYLHGCLLVSLKDADREVSCIDTGYLVLQHNSVVLASLQHYPIVLGPLQLVVVLERNWILITARFNRLALCEAVGNS